MSLATISVRSPNGAQKKCFFAIWYYDFVDHENFFENILGHQVKFSSVLHDHIYPQKIFEVKRRLDRNMKFKTCIIGHFFDLMITLRASIWSPFEHHFGVPPSLARSVGKNGKYMGRVWKLRRYLRMDPNYHQKKTVCDNSNYSWIYLHVKWRLKTLLNCCFEHFLKNLYEFNQIYFGHTGTM